MRIKIKSITCVMGIYCTTALSQVSTGQTLTVLAENFKDNSGQSVANLFVEGESLKRKPALQMHCKVVAGKAKFEFKDLPYGTYAVILWHDKNANGDLDHSFGMPSEPLGYSNSWSFGLFSGMPTFEKLKFNFSSQSSSITIKLK